MSILKNVHSIEAFLKLKFPDTTLVEGGLLHEKSRLIIAGDTGLGKSYLALQVAWESALGLPWLGIWPIRRPLRTFLLQVEVAEPVFKERCRRLATGRGLPPNLDVLTMEDFSLKDGAQSLTDTIAAGHYELVVLDPLYMMHDGDENAVHTIRPTQRIVDEIRRELGTTFIFVHHVRKSMPGERPSINMLRGSSGWPGWVDTVLLATPGQEDTLRLHLLKARNRQEALPHTAYALAWRKPGVFFEQVLEEESDPNLGEIVAAIEQVGQDGVAKANRVVGFLVAKGWGRSRAYRGIAEMVEGGFIVKDGRDLRLSEKDGGKPG